MPIGATVMSGVTILIIVPGVVAGIVALFEGMKLMGRRRSEGRPDPGVSSIIVPIPVIESTITKFDFSTETVSPAGTMSDGGDYSLGSISNGI